MKELFYKFRTGLQQVCTLLVIFTASLFSTSCSQQDELEIQQDFPFEVNVMPVPKEISDDGDTVEIRISIE